MVMNKHGMHFLLFLWRNSHIVAIKVAEVSVGVMRSRERLALKGYCGEREKLVAAVHDAVSVVVERIKEDKSLVDHKLLPVFQKQYIRMMWIL